MKINFEEILIKKVLILQDFFVFYCIFIGHTDNIREAYCSLQLLL